SHAGHRGDRGPRRHDPPGRRGQGRPDPAQAAQCPEPASRPALTASRRPANAVRVQFLLYYSITEGISRADDQVDVVLGAGKSSSPAELRTGPKSWHRVSPTKSTFFLLPF